MKKIVMIQLICILSIFDSSALIIENSTNYPFWVKISGYEPFEQNPEIVELQTRISQIEGYPPELIALSLKLKHLIEDQYRSRNPILFIYGSIIDKGFTVLAPSSVYYIDDVPSHLFYAIDFYDKRDEVFFQRKTIVGPKKKISITIDQADAVFKVPHFTVQNEEEDNQSESDMPDRILLRSGTLDELNEAMRFYESESKRQRKSEKNKETSS